MGRIVAIGGGTYEEMDPLISEIVKLSRKTVPDVLFIGTALMDSTNPLTSCKKAFKRVTPGCIVKKLSIIRTQYTEEQIDELLNAADVIFVGGGNTEYMLSEWKKIGLDEKLRRIFLEDSAVLCGVSAGAICWFERGFTDSDSFKGMENWSYRMMSPGFDLIKGAFCPHANETARSGFAEVCQEEGIGGYAVSDRAALILEGEEIRFSRASEDAFVKKISYADGGMIVENMI